MGLWSDDNSHHEKRTGCKKPASGGMLRGCWVSGAWVGDLRWGLTGPAGVVKDKAAGLNAGRLRRGSQSACVGAWMLLSGGGGAVELGIMPSFCLCFGLISVLVIAESADMWFVVQQVS